MAMVAQKEEDLGSSEPQQGFLIHMRAILEEAVTDTAHSFEGGTSSFMGASRPLQRTTTQAQPAELFMPMKGGDRWTTQHWKRPR